MKNKRYIRLIWSLAFLEPWPVLYALAATHRSTVWKTSLFMAPFGLAEPLFAPEYRDLRGPFDLAQRTGFSIEGLACQFAITEFGNEYLQHVHVAPAFFPGTYS